MVDHPAEDGAARKSDGALSAAACSAAAQQPSVWWLGPHALCQATVCQTCSHVIRRLTPLPALSWTR